MLHLHYKPKKKNDPPVLCAIDYNIKFWGEDFVEMNLVTWVIFEENGKYMCEICMN